MRIAAVGPLEFPGEQGGMSRHCRELFPRLVRRGHDVTVFCRSGEAVDGVHVRALPVSRSRGLERVLLGLQSSVFATLGEFDVVHYHSLVNTAFAFLPRVRARRTLVTVHALEWQAEKWPGPGRRMLRASERVALRTANAVIAVSRALAGDLRQRYPRARIHYVPNGVSLPVADGAALSRLGLGTDRYLLFVGRLVPEKGVDDLVAAFAGVRRAFPGVELAVAGGPRHSDAFVDALRSAAPQGVRLLGPQPQEVLAALYAGAAAFVSPSRREGQGLTVLEAMSAGCCVVASDIPPHREALGDSGSFVPVGDRVALERALHGVFENPAAAAAAGRAAQARIADGEYDWDRVADRTDEILRGL